MPEVYEDPRHFARLLRTNAELADYERRDVARLLETMADEIAAWRACAKRGNDGTPNGFRRAALERCRAKYITASYDAKNSRSQ